MKKLTEFVEAFLQPFKAFLSALMGDPVRKQFQKMEIAIKMNAQLVSDHEFHRVMEEFYTSRANSIDPHVDWWAFADAKEKQKEYRQQMNKISKKILSADAKLSAMEAAYKKVRDANTAQ